MSDNVVNMVRKSEVQIGAEAAIDAIQDKLTEIQVQLSVLASSLPSNADKSDEGISRLSERITSLTDSLTALQVEFSTHSSLCNTKWEQNEDSEKTQDQTLSAMLDKQQNHDVALQTMASRVDGLANKTEIIDTADATDLESALALVNELKSKFNSMQ